MYANLWVEALVLNQYVADRYGGKRALVEYVLYSAIAAVGGYKRFKQVSWHRVRRVVFVCKGNICRSAFADYRFEAMGGESASAGLEADTGKPADSVAQRVALTRGIDLSVHRSTHISEFVPNKDDLFVAFEPKHAEALRNMFFARPSIQVTLLGIWSPAPWRVYLHDPYGLSEAYFETCFERIERGIEGLLHCLSSSRKNPGNMP
jgi:protein-tyrosine phosphatase